MQIRWAFICSKIVTKGDKVTVVENPGQDFVVFAELGDEHTLPLAVRLAGDIDDWARGFNLDVRVLGPDPLADDEENHHLTRFEPLSLAWADERILPATTIRVGVPVKIQAFGVHTIRLDAGDGAYDIAVLLEPEPGT